MTRIRAMRACHARSYFLDSFKMFLWPHRFIMTYCYDVTRNKLFFTSIAPNNNSVTTIVVCFTRKRNG